MKFPKLSRRWWIAGGVSAGALLLVVICLAVLYPRVGQWKIRDKVGTKFAKKLGRDIRIGSIDVSLGHAVLRNVDVRGPLDGDTPLIHVDRVDVKFDALASLVGSVKIAEAKADGVMVTLRRDKYGRDNVRDILDRLRNDDAKSQSGGSSGLKPKRIAATRVKVLADDAMTGTTVQIKDGEGSWTKREVAAVLRDMTATTPGAPKAALKKLELHKQPGDAPTIVLEGGEISLWPRMALSGIGGKITQDPKRPTNYLLDFSGGYGGAPAKLWTAKGAFDSRAVKGSIDLVAAKFQLDRLAPILANSGVVDYQATSVDASLHVDLDNNSVQFSGDLNLSGLNVGHPMIAEQEVHDLDLSAKVAGNFDRATRTFNLTRGDFVALDVPFSITGTVISPRRDVVVPELRTGPVSLDEKPTPPMKGPYGIQILKLRLVIPPITCQKMIDAIPAEMAPYMQGYKLKGMFDVDINLDIDWMHLDNLALGGHVGINHCKVVEEPADSPKRLLEPFEHYVEYEKGEWMSFIVGPENPDFVPIDQISQNLVKSIMTTEDGGFYTHRGFIIREFRTALLNDLKAHAFKFGASSITMQMVKNVLLYREKTLARKLQELFLTWHVEHVLTKDRILEVYFNVIEFGPALYGIGPAARHYFGKHPRDLNPTEAAFFSSILPSPKARYRQYCQGTLTKWTTGKIERILALMYKRGKLTQEEYSRATQTPLVFVKDGKETEEDCMKRVKKAIKNSRSTNPLKK